ncbi:hypothetical protein BJY52DRAFT_1317536 [Lactarius psammicola]|nr:hypothetical protein BJY52DRAFT_1317536 [Lactarius psammicola]
MFVVFEAFPVIFIHVRHFATPHDGFVFTGSGIGSMIATLINIWFLHPYLQLMKEWHGFPPPEKRLYSAMVGTRLLAVSVFWLGWTGNYESVPWYVPALNTISPGDGCRTCFHVVPESPHRYLPNVFRIRIRSQHNVLARSAVGTALPLFTTQMYEGMGVN